MIFACAFHNNFNVLSPYHEIIVKLKPNHDLSGIPHFFSLYSNLHVIIEVEDEEHFLENNILSSLITLINNRNRWALKLSNPFDPTTAQIVELCRQEGVDYMFNMLVDSWEVLNAVADLLPSDIYIANALGFELPAVHKFLQEKEIKLRIFPNVAQTAIPNDYPITSFFIRSDDIFLYEPFIDVCEIFGPTQFLDFYGLMYQNHVPWKGNLDAFIIGLQLPEQFSNSAIPPDFPLPRLKCGRQCQKSDDCHFCDSFVKLALLLDENDMEFKQKEISELSIMSPMLADFSKKRLKESIDLEHLPTEIRTMIEEILEKQFN